VNPYDIMSITDTAAAGHPWATQSHAYTYDYSDRLLTASYTTPGNFAYAYDPLDNPTTWTTPSGTTNPTYNVLNQISTWGSLNYNYDADGNLLNGDGVKSYKWDAENRLIEIDYASGPITKSQFTYNGIGQRRIDVETAGGGGTTTTRYMWCGSAICQTRDGSDNVLRRHTAEGEYNVSTSQKLVYMPDHLGAVRDVLDATTGNLVQSYDYDPYGGITRSNGSTAVDYQYARLFSHPDSTLNLSSTRPYDPATGRWLTKDPIREAGGINLYGYAGANPINANDPLGLEVIVGYNHLAPITLDKSSDFVQFMLDAKSTGAVIDYVRFTGHADTTFQGIGAEVNDPEHIVYDRNSGEVLVEGAGLAKGIPLSYLFTGVKTTEGFSIQLNGCHSAENDDNIAKATSKAVPSALVFGSTGTTTGPHHSMENDVKPGTERVYKGGHVVPETQ
jgi:RHS repeat-associated protein